LKRLNWDDTFRHRFRTECLRRIPQMFGQV
jgi:hypothetical protein